MTPLLGSPGQWFVSLPYDIHHCVNVTAGHDDRSNGMLLLAITEKLERLEKNK